MQENSFFARLARLYLGHPKFQDVFMDDPFVQPLHEI
jgi:hypothetical protein